jgi:hypothetical protein
MTAVYYSRGPDLHGNGVAGISLARPVHYI